MPDAASSPLTDLGREMQRRYAWQAAAFFDLTRRPILLGRDQLAARGALQPGMRVLEVGCGTGHNLAQLADAVGSHGEVVAIECAPAMLRRAKRRIARLDPGRVSLQQGEYGRVAALPGSFDRILFAYSLSMIPKPGLAIAAALGDLAAGGQLCVLDFASSSSPWMRRRMRGAGVYLDDRLDNLTQTTVVKEDVTRSGTLGLWTWRWLRLCRR